MTGDTERVLADIDDAIDGYVTWNGYSADAMCWRADDPSTPEDGGWVDFGYVTDGSHFGSGGHDIAGSAWCSEVPHIWRNRWPDAWSAEMPRFTYRHEFDPERARQALGAINQTIVPQLEQLKQAFAALGRFTRRAVDANHPSFARMTMGDDYRRHRRRCRLCNPAGNPKPLAMNGADYARRRRSRSRRNRH